MLRHRHELLADQHARYARLWRAFSAWRRRVQCANERKQMIDAACVVGARFVQRRFFQRWRAHAAQQRAAGKGARAPPVDAVGTTSSQLRVVGAAIPRPVQTTAAQGVETVDQQSEVANRADTLQQLLDARDRRRLFRRWRSAAAALRHALEQKALVAANMLRFRVHQLLARWKRHATAARERNQLEQRARLFLYFCLTKRSLEQLRRHAVASQRYSAVESIAAIGTKRRTLRQMCALTARRRWLRGVCAAWRAYAVAKKKRLSSNPAVESAKLMVWSRYRVRRLREVFALWREKLMHKQLRASLVRVAQQYRVWAMRLAWSRWQRLVVQFARIEKWQADRTARAQQQIWSAWRQQTICASKKEQDRRRAVRFAYHRSQRKVFDRFLIAVQQSRHAAESADALANVRAKRMLARCFKDWIALAMRRRDAARIQTEADRLYRHALVSRVWTHGWKMHVASRASKRTKAESALRHFHLQLKRKTFGIWRAEWINQRKRNEELDGAAERFLVNRNQDQTARVFHAWLEYVRRRQAQRIVNAHIRGQWQIKMQRKCFSTWVAGVAEIRWKQIQYHRAQQQHAAKLKLRCFQFWKKKVRALKQLRDQNRTALIHWKLTVERKAFEGLKAYMMKRRAQRVRMHDALEFRHRLLVRDGVRHWMVAALHLQSQRENLASQTQAERAARIWRAVARIARHWRSVTINRRGSRNGDSEVRHIARGGILESSYRLHHDHNPHVGCYRSPPIRAVGKENLDAGNIPHHQADRMVRVATTGRSGLSEFVRHPVVNRPQPRRPIDLLLGDAFTAPQESPSPSSPNTAGNFNAVANSLNSHYGFAFPAPPFDPFVETPLVQDVHYTQTALSPRTPTVPVQQGASIPQQPSVPRASPTPPSTQASILSQLDTLEAQLRYWMVRKQRLKTLHDQIQAYRHQLAAQRSSHPSVLHQMQTELLEMEQEYGALSSKWLVSKERIRTISREILQLHAALQSVA